MKTVVLDLTHIETTAALHIYLQYMLNLPAYYGRNLDALYDVLGDVDEELHIVVKGEAAGENAAYLPKLLCVMRDAEKANPHLHIETEN